MSKELAPIVQSYINENTKGYIEPLVGGANMIDKIKCDNKIGYDIHKELIELLKQAQIDISAFPETISEEEYNKVKNNKEDYNDWYVGLVGFCGSFGAKYFGGYAKGNDKRDRQAEAINNIIKQSNKEGFKNIDFRCGSFLDLSVEDIKGYVIYCDPPYKDTTKYSTRDFPYEEFYKWCKNMSKHNTILVSEYNMPDGFECIWEKESKTSLATGVNKNTNKNRIEKLFIIK